MKPMATRAAAMPPFEIRDIMELAWKTPGCIHLEVGQPNFPTPEFVGRAGIEAIEGQFYRLYFGPRHPRAAGGDLPETAGPQCCQGHRR